MESTEQKLLSAAKLMLSAIEFDNPPARYCPHITAIYPLLKNALRDFELNKALTTSAPISSDEIPSNKDAV